MSVEPPAVITAVVERLPAWLRQDLSSSDAGVRARAEETLSAMIGDALVREARAGAGAGAGAAD